MSQRAACTIVARNYRAQARVLARSFLKHNPDARFFALVVDLEPDEVRGDEPFETVLADGLELGPELLRALTFQYTVLELCTALKPSLLSTLLQRYECTELLYIDPDVLVTASLEPLFEALVNSPILLLPHITRPLPDDGEEPDEVTLLRTGAYNLGFIGVARSATADELLRWWSARLRDRCVVRPKEGLFVDQKWIDLVPGLFEGTRVLRDPGYDVAYWNLHEHRITIDPEPRVGGVPLRFFHFSGFDPRQPSVVSRYQTRYAMEDLGEARELFERYARLLLDAGFADEARQEYRHARFEDGRTIAPVMRELYRRLDPAARARFGDPFSASEASFQAWLHAPAPAEPSTTPYVSNLLAFVWREPAAAPGATVPSFSGRDREGFLRWMRGPGVRSLGLDPATQQLVRAQVGGAWSDHARALLGGWLDPHACKVCLLQAAFGPGLASAVRAPGIAAARAPAPGGTASGTSRRSPGAGRLAPWIESALQPCDRHVALRRALGPRAERAAIGRATVASPALGVDLLHGPTRAEGARGLARALAAAGVPCREVDGALARRSGVTQPVTLVPVEPRHAGAWRGVQADLLQAASLTVVVWYGDAAEQPAAAQDLLDVADEVWTRSAWTADRLARRCACPVLALPLPLPSPARVVDRPADLPGGRFSFLCVMDPDAPGGLDDAGNAVEAFGRAFDDEDTSCVLVIASERRLSRDARASLPTADSRVRLHEGIDPTQLAALIRAADAFVSLHGALDFGLHLAAAMAAGRPVITTAYSGNVDYTHAGNAACVRYTLAGATDDDRPSRARPDLDHAAELMREVRSDRELADRLGMRAAADARERWSDARSGAALRARLELLRCRLDR